MDTLDSATQLTHITDLAISTKISKFQVNFSQCKQLWSHTGVGQSRIWGWSCSREVWESLSRYCVFSKTEVRGRAWVHGNRVCRGALLLYCVGWETSAISLSRQASRDAALGAGPCVDWHKLPQSCLHNSEKRDPSHGQFSLRTAGSEFRMEDRMLGALKKTKLVGQKAKEEEHPSPSSTHRSNEAVTFR